METPKPERREHYTIANGTFVVQREALVARIRSSLYELAAIQVTPAEHAADMHAVQVVLNDLTDAKRRK